MAVKISNYLFKRSKLSINNLSTHESQKKLKFSINLSSERNEISSKLQSLLNSGPKDSSQKLLKLGIPTTITSSNSDIACFLNTNFEKFIAFCIQHHSAVKNGLEWIPSVPDKLLINFLFTILKELLNVILKSEKNIIITKNSVASISGIVRILMFIKSLDTKFDNLDQLCNIQKYLSNKFTKLCRVIDKELNMIALYLRVAVTELQQVPVSYEVLNLVNLIEKAYNFNKILNVSNEKDSISFPEPRLWKSHIKLICDLFNKFFKFHQNKKLLCFCINNKNEVCDQLNRSHGFNIKCSICHSYQHVECISTNSIDHDSVELQKKEDFTCLCCRIVLSEPLLLIEKVLDIQHWQLENFKELKRKTFIFDLNLSDFEFRSIKRCKRFVQIRSFDMSLTNNISYCKFPDQVCIKILSQDGKQILIGVLKPPRLHQKRNDEPFFISEKYFDNNRSLKLVLECAESDRQSAKEDHHYFFALIIARSISAKTLFEDIVVSNKFNVYDCQTLCRSIRLITNTNSLIDNEIEIQQEEVPTMSLCCPSTLMRIDVPARGIDCMHYQCFDLNFYLYSQTRITAHKNRWRCPLCDKHCYPFNLIVDTFVEKILEQTKETENLVFLNFQNSNISWSTKNHNQSLDKFYESRKLLGNGCDWSVKNINDLENRAIIDLD